MIPVLKIKNLYERIPKKIKKIIKFNYQHETIYYIVLIIQSFKTYFNFTVDMWYKIMFTDVSQIQKHSLHHKDIRRPKRKTLCDKIYLQNC